MEFINRISIIRQITKCFFYLNNSILKINAIPCQSKDFTHTHVSSKCNNKKCICLTAFGCFKKNINLVLQNAEETRAYFSSFSSLSIIVLIPNAIFLLSSSVSTARFNISTNNDLQSARIVSVAN